MSGPRLAVFGGTTEGRILAERLEQEGFQGLLLVATEYGALLWGQEGAGIQVRAGRLEQDAMEALFLEEKIGLVIDATHPYAVRATENIRRACAACGLPLLRCLRGETGGAESNRPLSGERLVRFPDIPHAAEWLGRTQGRILLTTGSRDLAAFAATLAKGGVDPLTGRRCASREHCRTALAVMVSCGMYGQSGDFLVRTGVPAKSGVGGGIMAAVPGRAGIGVIGPALNATGNSSGGMELLARLAQQLDLSILS